MVVSRIWEYSSPKICTTREHVQIRQCFPLGRHECERNIEEWFHPISQFRSVLRATYFIHFIIIQWLWRRYTEIDKSLSRHFPVGQIVFRFMWNISGANIWINKRVYKYEWQIYRYRSFEISKKKKTMARVLPPPPSSYRLFRNHQNHESAIRPSEDKPHDGNANTATCARWKRTTYPNLYIRTFQTLCFIHWLQTEQQRKTNWWGHGVQLQLNNGLSCYCILFFSSVGANFWWNSYRSYAFTFVFFFRKWFAFAYFAVGIYSVRIFDSH